MEVTLSPFALHKNGRCTSTVSPLTAPRRTRDAPTPVARGVPLDVSSLMISCRAVISQD